MGGKLYSQEFGKEDNLNYFIYEEVEKYVRPSDLPVLNKRAFGSRFFDDYYQKEASQITIPSELTKSPEDTILNYFSVLRDAANHQEGKRAGCGTIGQSKLPYPFAYQFLSQSYQDKLSYEQYMNTFLNILHMNLIKYKEVPVYDSPQNLIRYFVEIETIEGSDKDVAYFAYYYGFVDLVKEDMLYKISNLEFTGEDYLCAPMHGWAYDAEANVQIRYGNWCNLIQERLPTQTEGYIKRIPFHGTDGDDYIIVFFTLTNDTDVEIAQYRKENGGNWELIKLDPKNCLKNKE